MYTYKNIDKYMSEFPMSISLEFKKHKHINKYIHICIDKQIQTSTYETIIIY